MKVVAVFELKDEYVRRMVEEYKNSSKADRDLSTPLGYFLYALFGGLVDFGMDADEVEAEAFIVPDGPFIFSEDREYSKLRVVSPEEFEKLLEVLV